MIIITYFSKNEDWNAKVRKSTIHRNPIGSKSQALERQRSRQSLRRHILECQDLSMNTENLLQYNPKLADVSKSTRVAYAKFMTAKIKKEIHFEEGRVQNETEVREKAQATRAFNRFKLNAGILKKSVYPPDPKPEPEPIVNETNVQSTEESSPVNNEDPPDEVMSVEEFREVKDFRSRTPIEEDPDEDLMSTYSHPTPEPFPTTSPNQSASPDLTLDTSPSPPLIPLITMSSPKSPKIDSPIPKLQSDSIASRTASSEPSIVEESNKDDEAIEGSEEDKTKEDETKEEVKDEPKAESAQKLNVPTTQNAPSSPSFTINASDKGKSKITGKTLSGWL